MEKNGKDHADANPLKLRIHLESKERSRASECLLGVLHIASETGEIGVRR